MNWKINLSPFLSAFLSPRLHNSIPAVVLLTMLSTISVSSDAGRYELIKRSAPGESYAYSDVPGGVCEAYEKNLARFENEPYGMACGRKLDQTLGFTRPKWKRLDPWKHQQLMKDIRRVHSWNRPADIEPNDWEGQLRHIINSGLVVEITRVDLDGDGRPENLIRTGKERICHPKDEISRSSMTSSSLGKRLLIADLKLTKVEATIIPPDDVFLYKGRVYSDALGMSNQMGRPGGPDSALFLFGFLRHGAGMQCKFHYYATPGNKPEFKERSKP